jgi:FKBP-type peptidyl-prolyl cis-trans isomerase
MRIRSLALVATIGLAVSACQAPAGSGNVSLETDDQRASYALGQDLGRNLGSAGERIDLDALVKGFRDQLAEAEPQIPVEEQQTALQAFGQSVQQARQAEAEAAAEENAAEGEAYLAENAERSEVSVTESGLQYEVIEEGDGPTPGADDVARLHYTGTLIDGTEFDSSRGGEPAEFAVGQVIPGFSEAIQLMPVGSTYRVVIPSDLAYGPQGTGGPIGPNETLIFEIELLDIVGDASGA